MLRNYMTDLDFSGDIRSPMLNVSRRSFLQGSAAALIIGMTLPKTVQAQSGAAAVIAGDGADAAFAPNAFIRVGEDDTVTVIIKHIEFGQGPYTGLSTLVAEEMDADWSQMRAESAPANTKLYKNLAFGLQGTGGSTAMANSYEQMRTAGATARAMLVSAAADEWGVGADTISVEKGVISHSSGKQSGFGALAAKAAAMPVPEAPTLKEPADFTLIGTDLPKLDTEAKLKGEAMYSLDIYRPGMLTVVVRHAPRIGATVASVDDAAARDVAGVKDVQTLSSGVAVYATNTFAALRGRDALDVKWDDSKAETRSTAEMIDTFRAELDQPGKEVESRGDIATASVSGDGVHQAEFVFPFLAHGPMETLDGVIEMTDQGVQVWMGSQMPTLDQKTIAETLGQAPDKVNIKTMFAGGSFGRRAQPGATFALELAEVMKESDGKAPLKLLWTREDDIRGGFYRPLVVHRMQGELDADGNISHWNDDIATQSIVRGTPFEMMIKDGIDPTTVEGARNLPYNIPNLHVSLRTMDSPVTVLWWRSVGHSHNAFATEVFLDELIEKAGRDPVEARLALIGDNPRYRGVLEAVAEMAGWDTYSPQQGRARGVALHKSFESYVAEIVEVSDSGNGYPRVHKVWCAVDCGVAVNPNVIAAQMEGGIGYGLSAILFNEVTLGEGGNIAQSNFHDYRSLRINEMPDVEVRVIKSAEKPTGVGEPGTPPIGPAVANAWRRLTGKPVRRLPMHEVKV